VSALHSLLRAWFGPKLTGDQTAYVQASQTLLDMQMALVRMDLKRAAENIWVLGYIYGVHCGLLQWRRMGQGLNLWSTYASVIRLCSTARGMA
jgi:hypothetical protein